MNTVVTVVLLSMTDKLWGLPMFLKKPWNTQGTIIPLLSISIIFFFFLCDTGSCLVQIAIQQLWEAINKIKCVCGNGATDLTSSLWCIIDAAHVGGQLKQGHMFFLLVCVHMVIEVSAGCAFFIFSVPAGSFAVVFFHYFNPILSVLFLLSSFWCFYCT